MIKHTTVDVAGGVGYEEPYFKALKGKKKQDVATQGGYQSSGGYQAGEMQNPPRKFPTSLASFVLVFDTDMEWRGFDKKEGDQEGPPDPKAISYAKLNMQPCLDKLRSSDMIVREVMSTCKMKMYALVSISEKRQRMVAEIMGEHDRMRVRMKMLDDEASDIKNGGAWSAFKNDLFPYYEKSSEGLLFSSCQQQYIMEFLLNDRDPRAMGPQMMQRESCLPGNSILQQMLTDEKIVDCYNLHHPEKNEWLLSNWAGTYTAKQPIEDIREYFGESTALFFVFVGYMVTSLWVLAGVGLFTFVMALTALDETGSTQNPYMPLFAVYVAIWSINFSTGWKRLEITYQYEWDVLEYEDPQEDRTEFVQNTKTYKRLNEISKKEEYYPDPLMRIISLIATSAALTALIVVTVFVAVLCEIGKVSLVPYFGEAGMLALILGANVQAMIIMLFRWGGRIVFRLLTDFENWKTEQQYEDAFITKLYCFAFCNAYFPIIFVAFIADSVQPFDFDISCGSTCADYVVFLTAIIYLQNVIIRAVVTIFFSKTVATADASDVDTVVPGVAELQHKLPNCSEDGGSTEEYLEQIIELGYVMMFSAACPPLAFFALVHNIWDLRSMAKKYLSSYRRPLYSCCRDIGTWTIIIDITTIMSIIVNSALIAFTSNTLFYYFPYMNEFDRVFYAVACEHLLLFLKALADSFVDVSEDLELACNKKKFEKSELLKDFDTANPEEDVAFYTSDDGALCYYDKDR